MNRKIFLWLPFTYLLSLSLKGQILNIDKTDTAEYTRKSTASFNLNMGLEIDKQKTTLYDATNTAEILWQHYKELFILASSVRFTYNGPDDILDAGYIHLRYRHNYRDRIQPEPYLQYQWDNKRGIERRSIAGINARFDFPPSEHLDFNCGLGPMYESEKWDYTAVDSALIPKNAQPIENDLIKINSYVRLDWKPDKNNDIVFNVFLQTRPDRFQPRIAPHAQWNIKAGKHLGFSVNFTGLYDTKPVVPIEKFYYSLSNSVLLSF